MTSINVSNIRMCHYDIHKYKKYVIMTSISVKYVTMTAISIRNIGIYDYDIHKCTGHCNVCYASF